MSVFRIRHDRRGAHIHCDLFVAKHPNQTYAKCGSFCISDWEWEDLRAVMSGVEFIERGEKK